MSPGPTLLIAMVSLGGAALVSRISPRGWLAGTLLGVGALAVAAINVLASGTAWELVSTFTVGGERVHLRLDSVSALFLVLLAVIAGAGAVYAREYWADDVHPRSAGAGRLWWAFMVAMLTIVLIVSNGLHFLIAWELFALAAYFLVTLDRQRGDVRAAGWLYLTASHAASLALFAFFALLAARTGSWELGPLPDSPATAQLAPLFWLALFGFGLKAGIFPLHIWLPSAHANAPSHVSAILSGVTIKIGIYGLVRFSGWLPVPLSAGWVVAALGVTSAVLGVAFALGQHDLKRLLAYHSVENIGIILIGLGFALIAVHYHHAPWGRLALVGGLLHVWNHGLFKALLFFGAGSVLHATGTREMSRLGGLWRVMPWTATLFALGAIAISGLPPLNGFVSEWLVFLGLFDALNAPGSAAVAAVIAVILLAVTGALALACFAKVCGVVFLGAPRSAAAQHAHESGPLMRGSMMLLAAGCVAIGLGPVIFWGPVSRAADAWNPAWSAATVPSSLPALGHAHIALALVGTTAVLLLWRRTATAGLRRNLTWDCGYAVPTARMQYTAGSFASTITGWFQWILRPELHEHRPEEIFPIAAAHAVHTPETVLVQVVQPAALETLRFSNYVRQLQHGRLQSYLWYLMLGIAGLAGLVMTGEWQ